MIEASGLEFLPNEALTGGMQPAERGRLLGHIELTGQRIDADLRRAS